MEKKKLSCGSMAESWPQSRDMAGSGRKAGCGSLHGQRPGYISFTFKVLVEQVCWEAEERNWGLSRRHWWSGTGTGEQIFAHLSPDFVISDVRVVA